MVPLVVQIEKTEQRTADTLAFKRSPVRLGRNPLNDLPLEEGFVSQWHAVVRFNAERTTVLDLGSTNRTTVNGKPIERNVEVPVDETSDVRIGSLRLHFLRVEAPPELFNQRRRSAFARVGNPEQGDVTRTMFFGDRTPPPEVLEAISSAPPAPVMQVTPHASAAVPHQPVAVVSPRPVAPSVPVEGSGGWGPKPLATQYGKSAPPTGDPLAAGYHAYRGGWDTFFAAVRARLQGLPAAQREAEIIKLQSSYPQLALEADFRAYLKQLGIDPLKSGAPEMEDWLRRLTDGLFPPPGASINIAIAVERVGELLEVFSQAFVEMRRAHEQFCREMSLTRYSDATTLQTHDDPRVVLAYLLTPTHEGKDRVNELQRALAEFALHQVALTSSVVEGARTILDTLAPKLIKTAQDPPNQSSALAEESVADKLWPYGARKLWRRFAARHYDLVESDRFTRDLFGRAFARRYYSMTGGNGND